MKRSLSATNYIGTEHILLGLVRENDGVAARILLDFDAEKIRDEIIRMLSGQVAPRRPPAPFSDPLRLIDLASLSFALEEAKDRLIEEHRFEGAAALRDRQRELQRLARDIESDLTSYGLAVAATPPEQVVREYDVRTLGGQAIPGPPSSRRGAATAGS